MWILGLKGLIHICRCYPRGEGSQQVHSQNYKLPEPYTGFMSECWLLFEEIGLSIMKIIIQHQL